MGKFSIVGSWNDWSFLDMTPSSFNANQWQAKFKIRAGGREEFKFVRDRDWQQRVYPAENHPSDSSIPVLGPNGGGADRNWIVRGREGETVVVGLLLENGEVKVSWQSKSEGAQSQQSGPQEEHRKYYVYGSWNSWRGNQEMQHSTLDGKHWIYKY